MSAKTPGNLREFIAACKELNDVREIDGADWNKEIGALTEVSAELIQNPPLLLFDKINGYPPGFRVMTLALASYKRAAMVLGLPTDKTELELIRMATRKLNQVQPLPPVEVESGPVMENVMTGDDVDLWKFPTPLFHELDGGRYIGTGDSIINKDPELGYINVGTYRIQVHGSNLLGLWMSPGQHGRLICQNYWAKGESCPVVVTFGGDMLTFMASHTKLPWGTSELDFVGGLRGKPLEVIKGPLTGLPIPADAEIAIEGEVPPPSVEAHEEGPFGEWPGYYSGGTVGTGDLQPIIKVKAIYHRHDPIINNMAPLWPGASVRSLPVDAGLLWDQLESAGIQDVVGVYHYYLYLVVVAIKQRYAGHAKQAGNAALSCSAMARNGRYIVVVDEDIDPTNIKEVLWAMETRVDPASDIDIIDGCWSTPLDPRMSPEKRASGDHTNSRAIFYAVRPFAWRDKFAKVSRYNTELRRQVMDKYQSILPFPK